MSDDKVVRFKPKQPKQSNLLKEKELEITSDDVLGFLRVLEYLRTKCDVLDLNVDVMTVDLRMTHYETVNDTYETDGIISSTNETIETSILFPSDFKDNVDFENRLKEYIPLFRQSFNTLTELPSCEYHEEFVIQTLDGVEKTLSEIDKLIGSQQEDLINLSVALENFLNEEDT